MNSGVISALAAIMGAIVGGLASLASTWISERSRRRRDILQREITKREAAYSEFIDRASKIYVASATRHIDADDAEIEGTISLYAVVSRIRLFASDQVITEAEKVIDQIFMQFGATNISVEQLRKIAVETRDDPLRTFSIVCRHELQEIQRGM
jgi:hypothetical protein